MPTVAAFALAEFGSPPLHGACLSRDEHDKVTWRHLRPQLNPGF